MRCINVLGGKIWNIRTHLVGKLIRNDRIAKCSHEQRRTLDLDAVLNRQERFVSLEIGLAIAVIVACCQLVLCRAASYGNRKALTGRPEAVSRVLFHVVVQLVLADQGRAGEC
jgi:hypothetical protein